MTPPRDTPPREPPAREGARPYGVVRVRGGAPQPALRDADDALLLGELSLPPGSEQLRSATRAPDLNALIELGPAAWTAVQAAAAAADPRRTAADPRRTAAGAAAGAGARVPLRDCEPVLPIRVTDFVDFYASLEHATNFGRSFRPGSPPVRENWRHMPIGYHGRASTIVVSGSPIARPQGQTTPGDLQPTSQLDLECELGYVCGPGAPGPIAIDRAEQHIFGVVLVNDWSARDIQRAEYEPLGPFLGKSFATSMSAWITPLHALQAARTPPPPQDPAPAPYLIAGEPWLLDVSLAIELNGEVISRPRAAGLYWTPAQMLAHLTVNGARLSAGDLFATGTISGAEPGTEGSLAERYAGERWLADGDEVVLRGSAAGIDLGEVRGRIAPA